MTYEEWLRKFGKQLRGEREYQKLTRNALAARLDTKPDYIAQLERGDKSPSMRTLFNILNVLDVSIDSLISETKPATDEKEYVLEKYRRFISAKSKEEIVTLFEIIRFLSKYIHV